MLLELFQGSARLAERKAVKLKGFSEDRSSTPMKALLPFELNSWCWSVNRFRKRFRICGSGL